MKKTSELIIGDKVKISCGIMEVLEMPRKAGKVNIYGQTYIVKSVCINGIVPGYFKPGSFWTIQGNDNATWPLVRS